MRPVFSGNFIVHKGPTGYKSRELSSYMTQLSKEILAYLHFLFITEDSINSILDDYELNRIIDSVVSKNIPRGLFESSLISEMVGFPEFNSEGLINNSNETNNETLTADFIKKILANLINDKTT
ncbi:hypothetical protein [Paenibacillus donghaensis]|uniref:Uncharacterized protein n=1 Tax=Paenibacillus donghaensis TaxID=414771 RepID=A0A2Z2KQS4_9BACL|nr:hypothetical protein [Paenibacillus donghaensis]ASA22701.1 hypothetical protein B9T62_19030 [Paenibacillus donghaensis]